MQGSGPAPHAVPSFSARSGPVCDTASASAPQTSDCIGQQMTATRAGQQPQAGDQDVRPESVVAFASDVLCGIEQGLRGDLDRQEDEERQQLMHGAPAAVGLVAQMQRHEAMRLMYARLLEATEQGRPGGFLPHRSHAQRRQTEELCRGLECERMQHEDRLAAMRQHYRREVRKLVDRLKEQRARYVLNSSGNANLEAPAARSLGNCHGAGAMVPFVNRPFEWGAVIATFLSGLSIRFRRAVDVLFSVCLTVFGGRWIYYHRPMSAVFGGRWIYYYRPMSAVFGGRWIYYYRSV